MSNTDPTQEWKLGDEFLPFHPQASHVPPDYRDGWNRCYAAAIKAAETVPTNMQALTTEDLCTIVGRKADGSDDTKDQCGNCQFWKKQGAAGFMHYGVGACRRYPPQRIPGDMGPTFPTTDEETWCGEHKR
jgi:hypothetical protein